MKRALIAQVSIVLVLALAVLVSSAGAFETYSSSGGATGNCADCHGAFNTGPSPYISLHDGVAWKNPPNGQNITLHDGHRYYMLSSDCNTCHFGSGKTPVYTYQSNGGVGFPAIGCTGCHVGDGLRAHHVNSGAYTCYDCHSPGTPPAENVAPPYYFTPDTTHPNKPTDPCNANGSESKVAPPNGLDNDGNLLYDQNDPACKPSAPVLVVSPTTLTFGNQNVGTTSATQTVTISNTGTAVLTVSALTNSNTTDFSVTSAATPFNVNAGANQTFTVAFKPGSTGAKTATISITSNGGNASVSATGTGTTAPAPVLGVSPTTLTFGNQNVGTTSAGQTVTISNTGNAPLNVSSISSSSAEFKFSPATLSAIAAGGSATLSVTFAPGSAGAKTATISITSDGGNGSVNATGTGVTPSVSVPNVVGMTQSAATTAITGAGLTVGTVTTQSSSTVPSGQVISQNPTAGTSVASGSAVNLVVSSGAGTTGGDVALVKLTEPNQLSGRVSSSVRAYVGATATSTPWGATATVKLSASSNSGVTVKITSPSVTKVVRRGEEDNAGTVFGFLANVTCNRNGTFPVTWTAKISSTQDSNPGNDTLTGTTQIKCSGQSESDNVKSND